MQQLPFWPLLPFAASSALFLQLYQATSSVRWNSGRFFRLNKAVFLRITSQALPIVSRFVLKDCAQFNRCKQCFCIVALQSLHKICSCNVHHATNFQSVKVLVTCNAPSSRSWGAASVLKLASKISLSPKHYEVMKLTGRHIVDYDHIQPGLRSACSSFAHNRSNILLKQVLISSSPIWRPSQRPANRCSAFQSIQESMFGGLKKAFGQVYCMALQQSSSILRVQLSAKSSQSTCTAMLWLHAGRWTTMRELMCTALFSGANQSK